MRDMWTSGSRGRYIDFRRCDDSGRNIDDCQYVPTGEVSAMPGAAFPVEVTTCCAPLRAELLTEADATTLAAQFAALADPVRLQLLSLLATDPAGAICAC